MGVGWRTRAKGSKGDSVMVRSVLQKEGRTRAPFFKKEDGFLSFFGVPVKSSKCGRIGRAYFEEGGAIPVPTMLFGRSMRDSHVPA